MARILLVDDDPSVTTMLCAFLRAAGHVVDVAHTLRDGRRSTEDALHDAYVLDLNLPDGRGFDLIRLLREDLKRDTPVLVLSGQKQEASVLEALGLGADDFVRKPFSPREVVARIGRMVG
jgi:two-component system, OmpR family, phosphate regulon response regulator PhoB